MHRYYIQPQWIADSVNHRELLPVEDYFPGVDLPPHLSPFVKEEEGDYIPPERQTMLDKLEEDNTKEVDKEGIEKFVFGHEKECVSLVQVCSKGPFILRKFSSGKKMSVVFNPLVVHGSSQDKENFPECKPAISVRFARHSYSQLRSKLNLNDPAEYFVAREGLKTWVRGCEDSRGSLHPPDIISLIIFLEAKETQKDTPAAMTKEERNLAKMAMKKKDKRLLEKIEYSNRKKATQVKSEIVVSELVCQGGNEFL